MHFVCLLASYQFGLHMLTILKKAHVKLHFVSSPALDVFAHVDKPFVSSLALHVEMHLWLGRGL